jgi:hypothetical protein
MTDLKTTRLDFDGIKEHLKLFLESQTELQDYNFTGSTMNVIVDVLAYTTHYNALYAQQASNETFLDTALLRSSVVSRAKELGYIPRQYTPARVDIDISVTVPAEDVSTTFIIPVYTKFTGEKDGASLPFRNIEQVTLTERVGDVFSGSITLYQGENVEQRFVYNGKDSKFVLSPERVYTDLFVVDVLPFVGAGSKDSYTTDLDVVDITAESKVFFWQESVAGDIEIFFGDGVLGQKLSSGNEIAVGMFTTLGESGNSSSSFSAAQAINGINVASIVTTNTNPSRYGSGKEDIESIRLLAPKAYTAQNRLVTIDDYIAYNLRLVM